MAGARLELVMNGVVARKPNLSAMRTTTSIEAGMRRKLQRGGVESWFVAMVLIASACRGGTAKPVEPGEETQSALGRTIARDVKAPVQTERLVYELTQPDEGWFAVDVAFQYTNDTGRKISIVNCNGGLNTSLEKHVDGTWEQFYAPALLMCLSPPIHIAARASYEGTARVHGALPGRNAAPELASEDLDGEYRLVWGSLVHDYDENLPGFGEPVGPLRSNPFLLVDPR
jgi:hypothetical protein